MGKPDNQEQKVSEANLAGMMEDLAKEMEEFDKHHKIIHGGKLEEPLQIKELEFRVEQFKKQSVYVAVRPVDDEKTYLGLLIGEYPIGFSGIYAIKDQKLTVMGRTNPMIFIPELERVVFGYESWWGRIKSEDQLKQITDADIQNVWYVKALKTLSAEKKD